MKKLVVFDLDGTLAASKAPLDAEMGELLCRLLAVARAAVISGGSWKQFTDQLLANLPDGGRLENLSLLPTCGTQFFEYRGGWNRLYAEDLDDAEKSKIVAALGAAVEQAGIKIEKTWGDQIEDRKSQITFSALGQHAPLDAKEEWDPDFEKRKKIKAFLDGSLSDFSVRLGGATSIDVTRPGVDKAYGIRKLRDLLNIAIDEMIFVGDAVFPGGNDYPAKEAGAASIRVRDPDETKRVVEAVILCMGGRIEG